MSDPIFSDEEIDRMLRMAVNQQVQSMFNVFITNLITGSSQDADTKFTRGLTRARQAYLEADQIIKEWRKENLT